MSTSIVTPTKYDPVAIDFYTLKCELFSRAGKGRDKNDLLNKQREMVLEIIIVVSDDKLPTYWKEFKHKWKECLTSISTVPFDIIKVSKMAGRAYNHDFNITFFKDNIQVEQFNVEFKHNSKRIDCLPQFLSLQEKILGYPSYYYDNYLKLYGGRIDELYDQRAHRYWTIIARVVKSVISCYFLASDN